MKYVYAINHLYGNLVCKKIAITKETKKLYYLDDTESLIAVKWRTQLRKCDEGVNWTTDETKFKEIAQHFVKKMENILRLAIFDNQLALERLKQKAHDIGLEVDKEY